MEKNKIIYFLLCFLLIPSLCFADGGAPILLLVNGYSFLVGFILVFIIEFYYLCRLFKNQAPKKTIAGWTFLINIASTIVGALIIPLVLGFTGLEPLIYYPEIPSFIWPLSFSLDFIITYFVTVFIEYWLLKKLIVSSLKIEKDSLLKNTFLFNLISYIALILILVATLVKMNIINL